MSHELTKYFSGPQVLNGKPGYINLLDALNSWALVKEVQPEPLHQTRNSSSES